MAMRLGTFTGDAEVCGVMRRVEWDGEVVHVFGVKTYDDAMRVLGQAPDFPASWNDASDPVAEGTRAELIAQRGEAPSGNLPRTPDGRISNCALANAQPESECQMCKGACPDMPKAKTSPAQDYYAQKARADALTDKARADAEARQVAHLAARRAAEAAETVKAKAGNRANGLGPRGGVRLENGTPLPSDEAHVDPDDIPFGQEQTSAVRPVSRTAETAAPAAPAAPDAPADSGGSLVEDVQAAFLAGLVAQTSIRSLIQYFFDNGLTDRNDIVSICKTHKKTVPALARVSNIDDRLGRALEALESP